MKEMGNGLIRWTLGGIHFVEFGEFELAKLNNRQYKVDTNTPSGERYLSR